MERSHLLAFDDFVPTNSVVRTSSWELDQKLGKFDQMALFCVLSKVPAPPPSSTAHFYVYLTHSGDGETFLPKNGTGGPPPTNSEIDIPWTAAPAGPLVAWGSDPNALVNPPTPFLRYVRINVFMIGSTAPVHARVYVTQRDQGD
jgi:hypothetical protein